MQKPQTIQLPWPPSKNAYLRAWIAKPSVKTILAADTEKSAQELIRKLVPRNILTAKARDYHNEIGAHVASQGVSSMGSQFLKCGIWLYPPTKRIVDVDSRLYCILDSLQEIAYDNDNQIKKLYVEVCEKRPPGCVIVKLWPLIQETGD